MTLVNRAWLCLGIFASTSALAFDPPTQSSRSLVATIEPLHEVRVIGEPVTVAVRLENRSDGEVSGEAEIKVVDRWRVEAPATKPFAVGPRGTIRLEFHIVAGEGTLPELYPVQAFVRFREGDEERVLHPVLIFKPEVPLPAFPRPAGGTPTGAIPVPPAGEFRLARADMAEVRFQVFGRDEVRRSRGWDGSDEETGTHFSAGRFVERGGALRALSMHPPWRTGPGTIHAEYRLTLPPVRPSRLRFSMAIRDHVSPEPVSDGVTFRVWARRTGDAEPTRLFERHTDAKEWVEAEVDLSRYGGESISLGFECHPGPKNDTTCDSAFWGEPVVIVGEPEEAPAERILTIATDDGPVDLWCRRGDRGLFDSVLIFCKGGGTPDDAPGHRAEGRLSFRGFDAEIRVPAGPRRGWDALVGASRWEPLGEGIRVIHSMLGTDLGIVAEIRPERGGVWISWESAARIERLEPGPFSSRARRVFAGAGNVIVDPGSFTLEYDGHRLSTRHVGFDFENGWSVLQATDPPPDRLVVTPGKGIYALAVHPGACFFFAPRPAGTSGGSAMGLVKVWRDACGLKPSGGVKALGGRFVFDLWGGRYGPAADALARSCRYGLTHSLVVWHNWQRWGYDYRLPDIFPPNPALGTLDEFKRLAETCRQNGILFAPHDNYIDLYPDADGFTYDDVCFHGDGRPVRAWFNEGRGAQSFRFRPDRFQPYMRRNLELLRDAARPTAYFVDVFSSIGLFDYYDRAGGFHSKTETQRLWGEAFAWAREFLGGAAQVSESGHDGLIGWLDGAQTNHLRVDASASSWTTWRIRCADSERVPWFDLAYRDRFVLHGAGYSGRYQGGLSGEEHGIQSDDYVTTEVLTGHPGMVPRPFGRDVVRKYWLTHDLMDAVALVPMKAVEFDGGDIHRQTVTYENGAVIRVNRGPGDWTVDGHVLPRFGFWGRSLAPHRDPIEAAIERIDGVIVEWARGPGALYADPRTVDPFGRAGVTPRAASVAPVGDRAFEIEIAWNVETGSLDSDYGAFVHFLAPEGDDIAFQADHRLPVPTSRWARGVTTSRACFAVPASARPGRYSIAVGLWSSGTGRRVPLSGPSLGQGRTLAGHLVLTEDGKGAVTASLLPPPPGEPPRWNVSGTSIDFGWVKTDGAFRIVPGLPPDNASRKTTGSGGPPPSPKATALRILPLPESRAFSMELRLDRLPWAAAAPGAARASSIDGEDLGPVPLEVKGRMVRLQVPEGVFEVRLR